MFLDGIDEQDATGELATWYEHQRKAWGYLPNYAPIFSSRADVALAWTNLNLTIRGGMDRRLFELATIAAARALNCTYCLAAPPAPGITPDDVQTLTDQDLTKDDVANVIFAVGARAYFATVLDAAGALADHQLGQTFDDATREQLVVGRPFADAP